MNLQCQSLVPSSTEAPPPHDLHTTKYSCNPRISKADEVGFNQSMMYQFLRLEQIKHIKIKAGLRTDGKHLKTSSELRENNCSSGSEDRLPW